MATSRFNDNNNYTWNGPQTLVKDDAYADRQVIFEQKRLITAANHERILVKLWCKAKTQTQANPRSHPHPSTNIPAPAYLADCSNLAKFCIGLMEWAVISGESPSVVIPAISMKWADTVEGDGSLTMKEATEMTKKQQWTMFLQDRDRF